MTVHLKDIAAYTGVSIKTVSNVVNGNTARVSPETRALILEAIEKLQYRPNIAARHLRTGQVGVIALTIPDLTNPYFSEIGDAVTNAAAELGYAVLLDYTRGEREKELLVIKGLRPHLIDGVILDASALTVDDIQAERISGHIVLIGERLFNAPCDHILIDNVSAARTATEHLLALKRERIAAIGAASVTQHNETPVLRLEGYLKAMQAYGREIEPELLVKPPYWNRAGGAEAMRYLLTLERRPDAVFCFNDLMALGALSVLHEAGLRVPEDIALVGFDDIEDGRYAQPSLTTIAPEKAEIGRIAATLLIGRIRGERQQAAERITVPFRLCVRRSSVRET